MSDKHRVAVLGAGSWGTTLAIVLEENGHDVVLWEFFEELADEIRASRENAKFLPGVRIPGSIRIESDLVAALDGADIILNVVPSHVTREVAKNVRAAANTLDRALVVNASKGLEEGSLKRMSEVLQEELGIAPEQISTLAGPSHAEEVSRKMPTSVVVAGSGADGNVTVQHAFMRPYFRIYTNSDIVGVELGVSLKNIVAIAAGICDGLGYGDNTKAALLTRGLVEVSRLGAALGARPETFFGLAGIGDLIATSLSQHSRNRHVGERVGKGESLESILGDMVMVAEGVRTTRAAADLGKRLEVELPIISAVNAVLFDGLDPESAIDKLMNRPPQEEMSWMQTKDSRGGSS